MFSTSLYSKFQFRERLGVLAAACAARKRLALRTSAIRRIQQSDRKQIPAAAC